MKGIVYHFNPAITQLEASKIIGFNSNKLLPSYSTKVCSIVKIRGGMIEAMVDGHYAEEAVRNYALREDCIYLKSKFKT